MNQTSNKVSLLRLTNAQSAASADVPRLSVADFRRAILDSVAAGGRISALLGSAAGEGETSLLAVMSDDRAGDIGVCSTVVGGEYPSLTPDCPQAHLFEREIAEQWHVRPVGHPWLKPVRFPWHGHLAHDVASSAVASPSASSFATARGEDEVEETHGRDARGTHGRDAHATTAPTIGVADFFQVCGEEVHEVAVGPVHAGIIEPGHFRFQCHGEDVLHLEISLGYQHRGVERAMLGGPSGRAIHYMETLAGDTTVGHAAAYCQAVEALSLCRVPARAQALRGVGLELERVANHVGDLGALAGDVGFLPTASYCGRIRGDVLNVTAALCGSRFGRGLVRPGGTGFDVDDARIEDMLARLEAIGRDSASAVNLLWETPSVQARLEGTGTVTAELAAQIGLVGPAARASGLERDVRHHHPCGIYRFANIPQTVWDSGDVFARAYVRWLEVQRSLAFIAEQLRSLPAGEVAALAGELAPGRLAVSLVEGWRGEICHVAVTDDSGRFARYKVVDPSFHNWFGLACALRDGPISDFPLCNKSFNLSYCGHDL
jgi:Ni,Fe-hydrogenase III large subunit